MPKIIISNISATMYQIIFILHIKTKYYFIINSINSHLLLLFIIGVLLLYLFYQYSIFSILFYYPFSNHNFHIFILCFYYPYPYPIPINFILLSMLNPESYTTSLTPKVMYSYDRGYNKSWNIP